MNKSKSKSKNKISSQSTKSNTKRRILNSYGYDVSDFTVLDIPARRESKTGRLVSVKQASKRTLNDPS